MVVNTVAAEKTSPLPVANSIPEKQNYPPSAFVAASAPPPYSRVKGGKPRKCCFVASLAFNLVLIALLVMMAVFLCKHREKTCELQVKYDKLRFSTRGIDYVVRGCKVKPIYKDFVFPGEPEDDVIILEEDDRDERREERDKYKENKWKNRYPDGRPRQ